MSAIDQRNQGLVFGSCSLTFHSAPHQSGDESSDGLLASGDFHHYGSGVSSSLANHHNFSLDLGGPSNSSTLGSVSSANADGDNLNNAVDVGGSGMELVRYGPSFPPFYSSENMSYSKDIRDSKAVHGSCGLYNLGNTCFMNSGLQSLMSCAPLVKFFCESYTLTDDNRHTLTAHFYVLLCKMWSGQFSVVHPRKFKDFLGLYHSQFEDYRQHDCQEFLALLLDTLHEQLNKAVVGEFPPQLTPTSPSQEPLAVAAVSSIEDAASSSVSATNEVEVCRILQLECNSSVSLNNESLSQANKGEVVQKQLMNDQEDNEGSTCSLKRRTEAESHVKIGEVSDQSLAYPISEGSPVSEISMLDSVLTSPSSRIETASSLKSPERNIVSVAGEMGTGVCGEEEEVISSSFPPLQRYTSRSNIDDVTSSDSNTPLVKPSLKRVSSGSSMSTTCGQLLLHSEDSNHSSLSAHSTDSEQSSAFKRLKIDAVELGRNSSSNNNSSLKDCVTSSSDCKKNGGGKEMKPVLLDDCREGCNAIVGRSRILREAEGSDACVAMSPMHDLTVIDNMVSSCQDSLEENLVQNSDGSNHLNEAESLKERHSESEEGSHSLSHHTLSPSGLPCLDDFYSKETKTLNTNVQVSDFLQEITADSEKFAKVDNRNRPPSKEVNILQEAFGEEDKAEKVLIGQSFGSGAGVKDINLYAQSSSASVVKPCKNVDLNVLHNSLGQACVLSEEPLKLSPVCEAGQNSIGEKEEVLLLKHGGEGDFDVVSSNSSGFKFDEEEKNVQMQAYSKFNTIPERSNIRVDLSDSVADPDSMEVDEVEMMESSDEEELELVSPSHTSTVEACSSVPNCLRNCPLSEVRMATHAWEEYQASNDSIVVSTFQGQFRSTVVCSECSHVSVTYEPFMYLSLPIPHAMDQQLCVTYISQHKPPVKYLLNLLKTDKVSAAKQQLNQLLGRSQDEEMVMAEVLDSHISRILDSNVLLKYINTFNRKIYAFELITSFPPTLEVSTPSPCRQEEEDHSLLNHTSPGLVAQQCQKQGSSPSSLGQSRTRLVPEDARDNQEASNQSFDSVVVNSPSSRDTLDCMLSDSEGCDLEFSSFLNPGSVEAAAKAPVPSAMPANVGGVVVSNTDSEATAKVEQSNYWLMDDCVSDRRLSCCAYDDDYDKEDDDFKVGESGRQFRTAGKDESESHSMVISSSSPFTHNHGQSNREGDCSSPSSSQFWVNDVQLGSYDRSKMILDEEDDNEAEAEFIQESPSTAVDHLQCDQPEASTPSSSHITHSSIQTASSLSTKTPTVSSSSQQARPLCGDQVSSSEGSNADGKNITPTVEAHPSAIEDHYCEKSGSMERKPVSSDLKAHHGWPDGTSSSNSTGGCVSRSCPSPTDFSPLGEHGEASILGAAAAKLGENPGSYFLHHGAATGEQDNDYDYYDDQGECSTSKTAASTSPGSKSQKKSERECEGPDWSNTFPVHNFTAADVQQSSYASISDQWKSCAICLEDLIDTELLTHVMCDGVFCQNCLEMSVKHTVDVSSFSCPICLQPANMCEDFVPLASATGSRPKIRTVQMSIAFRQSLKDNTEATLLQLFGHPNIVHMPSLTTGQDLYRLIDQLVSPLLPVYSILLTDGQGLTCSRCPYSVHCTGCQISREACELSLQPSDCLTVHVGSELTPDQLTDLQLVHDDASMAGLRSSEPTTIMDCFGAFTQSELLDEHNPWFCPRCERNQCAKKTMTVWRYPDNLIIHLKRFVYQDLSSTKVDAKVVFPHEGMDVRGFLSGPSSSGLLYDLHSIVCHLGGASAGHYTCFARHPLTHQWNYYNDETVSAQEPGDAEFTSGYVLFYQRQGTEVNFTIPESIPCMNDEDQSNIGSSNTSGAAIPLGPPTSSSSALPFNYTGSNSITTTTCVFAMDSPITVQLVFPVDKTTKPYQPALPSSSMPIPDNSNDDDDDYDNERRCSPCDQDDDDTALTVHFGSSFPNPDQMSAEVDDNIEADQEACEADEKVSSAAQADPSPRGDKNEDSKLSHSFTEPDSTLILI
ncbi:ubiquitin carboxyl-terminal hydrolase [Plakobranchus ocellatus]|uniref:ubiquitinyl hydrolase 1 n=1 Tax=Plakobranchus ocellatus TaxID=259542 RepID=A0AAV3ZSV3_9GAST|nr:ubiquitin carboxyl-terminal hydrolase [Plakobranchus ocellatus]